MDQQSFEQLADQAAAGLRNDRELYLDVKQELRSHLDEKAEHFVREGHSPEESIELSKKSLGSPIDLAAELFSANQRRMKLRSLIRIGFGALIVPLSIVLALYLGYNRFVELSNISLLAPQVDTATKRLPTLPLLNKSKEHTEWSLAVNQLAGGPENAASVHSYWETHRADRDSNMYYAYYALFVKPESEQAYVEAMRKGEQIELDNALYNVLLVSYYLKRGVLPRESQSVQPNEAVTDKMLDRRAFRLGIEELHKAVQKPYMRTYQMRILTRKLNMTPRPVLTEDYLRLLSISAAETFPFVASNRDMARRVSACARLLASEGRFEEAEAVMDTWKPFTMLLVSDNSATLIHMLSTHAIARILTGNAGPIYDHIGAGAKAQEARAANERLSQLTEDWREASSAGRQHTDELIQQRGSKIAGVLLPVFGYPGPTEQDLKPGRMHEHVLAEEVLVQAVMVALVLALLGTLLQGAIWLFRLRGAASIPLLLMPPTRQILRALLLGIALPAAIYWIYSRLPVIGGREFSWSGEAWLRFATELCVLGIAMLWIPTRMLRRYIRQRCANLDIAVPEIRDEMITGWKIRAAFLIAPLLAAVFLIRPEFWGILKAIAVALVIAVAVLSLRGVLKKRAQHGIYYGTLARSLAPVYAISIIFISVTLQPLLLYSEAMWLRKDTFCLGYFASQRDTSAGLSSVETKVAKTYYALLTEAVQGEK